jgi:hypothetical protein
MRIIVIAVYVWNQLQDSNNKNKTGTFKFFNGDLHVIKNQPSVQNVHVAVTS